MTCDFGHFFLSSHTSVAIVNQNTTENMPVKVLIPRERIVMYKSLFINEKSHLLRDEINDTIYHRRGDNLKRPQQLLLELWSRNHHTLAIMYI